MRHLFLFLSVCCSLNMLPAGIYFPDVQSETHSWQQKLIKIQ